MCEPAKRGPFQLHAYDNAQRSHFGHGKMDMLCDEQCHGFAKIFLRALNSPPQSDWIAFIFYEK